MPNKTRFVIYPDRIYTVMLDSGEEVEVSGSDIIGLGYQINKTNRLINDLKEIGDRWLEQD